MRCEFTLQHYEEICKAIHESNYSVCTFDQYEKNQSDNPLLIMRHDIDQCLHHAWRMANIEKKYEIASTYFLWLRSPFYNIFNFEEAEIIKGIINMGHHIGLHFDETNYGVSPTELKPFVDREARVIEDFFDIKISAVSMHRPSPAMLEMDVSLGDRVNTYSHRFFREFTYRSDSRKQWKQGCICHEIRSQEHKNLHILTHPIWWEENSVSAQETLENFWRTRSKKIDRELERNVQVYQRVTE